MSREKKRGIVKDEGGTRQALEKDICNSNFVFENLHLSKKAFLVLGLVVGVAFSILAVTGTFRESGTTFADRYAPPTRENPIEMTKVEANVGKALLEIPLEAVRENKLVSFEYKSNNGTRVPLLALMTPKGKVMTAVGVSEPCNSESFRIEGNDLVCNICDAHWALNDLKWISGDCSGNGPERVPHLIEKGRLIISELDVRNWKPRIGRG